WARDNIASFGGDPDRMIIFGESAGGASVDMYSYAYKDDPIVKGFIAESGTVSLGGAGSGSALNAWYSASEKLGCGGKDAGNATVECVRGKTTQEILDAIKPPGAALALSTTPFSPAADSEIVFNDYTQRLADGNFIKAVSTSPLPTFQRMALTGLPADARW